MGPGHSVGLVVKKLFIAGNICEACSTVKVLLLVVESDKLSGSSEVDDSELIVFKVRHLGVVAENECKGVASLIVPG